MRSIPVGHGAQIRPYVEYLDRAGVSVEAALSRAGLPPLLDRQVELPVSTVAEGRFLLEATRRSGIEEFVWCAVSDPLVQLSGRLLHRLAVTSTLLQGMKMLCSAASGESSRLSLWLVDCRDGVTLFHRGSTAVGQPGTDELTLMRTRMLLEVIRGYTADDWSPSICRLALERMPGPRARVELRLGPTSLDAKTSCFFIPRSLLANAPRLGFFSRALRDRSARSAPSPRDFLGSFEALLRPYVASGLPSLQDAAAIASASPRTLQRTLAGSGTTYQGVLDKLRLEAAMEALADPSLRIVDAAVSTGFRDQAHFTHFFKRKCGVTPQRYRRSRGIDVGTPTPADLDGANLQEREANGT